MHYMQMIVVMMKVVKCECADPKFGSLCNIAPVYPQVRFARTQIKILLSLKEKLPKLIVKSVCWNLSRQELEFCQ